MKNFFPFTIVITGLLITGTGSRAQTSSKNYYVPTIPAWVPVKGFWVIESNNRTPGHCTVFFYNDAKEMVYKETIEGIRVNTNSKIVKMHLKHVLDISLLAWKKEHRSSENKQLLIRLLRKR